MTTNKARAVCIRERMAGAILALNGEDAALLGVVSGQSVACEIGGEQQCLTLEVHPEMPHGLAGIAGLATVAHALPTFVRITPAGSDES